MRNYTDGVLYFNAGSKHGVHLVVSLMALRDWYVGPVAIATEISGPGRDVAEAIAATTWLGPVQVIADERLMAGGHGVSYLCKTLLPLVSPFDRTIFMDADTVAVGSFEELWPAAGQVHLTQFSTWVSTGGKMRQRILGWEPYEPERVARMLERKWPAINTGIMAWDTSCGKFAEDWHATAAKRRVFMTDETAAQVIFPDHDCKVLDRRFNCSVVFDCDELDPRIWHGHGGKFWKRQGGRAVFVPLYRKALAHNMAGIRDLRPVAKWFHWLGEDDQAEIKKLWTGKAAFPV